MKYKKSWFLNLFEEKFKEKFAKLNFPRKLTNLSVENFAKHGDFF